MLFVNKEKKAGCNANDIAEQVGIDELYRRYRISIRRYIERQFGMGPPDPEDAVQAAFERFAKLTDRQDIVDPYSFLRRTARNFMLDQKRAQKVRFLHREYAAPLNSTLDELDAERFAIGRERLAIIEEAVRNMDDNRRNILIMSRIRGMSSAAIARSLGCSPTLVKMRLAEALVICQRALRIADGDE